ncbi:hypothetical protein JH06_1755 [Blastocystis sp. subtype 4]|uniref:hypothetical protein n=1 Tax=Blastocystis sp. subtype 4 TaxID=944170 RepID=UPI000711C504|nr:hypothetical protein JH06_1755 [Blastocystis sp. subtype 4]KNB45133.1 hypothetical protein JH06_1755 [Blastocystis sp. subtype 4]|eukprot:XP_014528571.1 hypothetical protein JH06_1755 [Blastocystis sp. subtype 4]
MPVIDHQTLGPEQKEYLKTIRGNPSHIKRMTPFISQFSHGIGSRRDLQMKRARSGTQNPFSSDFTKRLQDILYALINKSWDGYYGDNPFKPRLTTRYLKECKMEDYFEKVSVPMSLTDIGNKIKDNAYESIEEMDKDVKLIMDNARTYHGVTAPIAKMASELYDVSLYQ